MGNERGDGKGIHYSLGEDKLQEHRSGLYVRMRPGGCLRLPRDVALFAVVTFKLNLAPTPISATGSAPRLVYCINGGTTIEEVPREHETR